MMLSGARWRPSTRAWASQRIRVGPYTVLDALDGLLERATGAKALVNDAVAAGRIPGSSRAFWLRAARHDLGATNLALNSSPAGTFNPATSVKPTEAQIGDMCRQLGITREQYDAGAGPTPEPAGSPD